MKLILDDRNPVDKRIIESIITPNHEKTPLLTKHDVKGSKITENIEGIIEAVSVKNGTFKLRDNDTWYIATGKIGDYQRDHKISGAFEVSRPKFKKKGANNQ